MKIAFVLQLACMALGLAWTFGTKNQAAAQSWLAAAVVISATRAMKREG